MAIIVINPNSNQAVTDSMAIALQPLEITGGPSIECETLHEGPFGIESQMDVEAVVLPLRQLVATHQGADAFVIACYSDPGLAVCREATSKPVFGIQECGILTALSYGGQFGVIALSDSSVKRHLRYIRQMGVMDRLAGEIGLGITVKDSAEGEDTFSQLCEAGVVLRDQDGADAIILGCAGMARHRPLLEDYLGIPVIDPVQAATVMAIGSVLLRKG